MKNLNWYLVNLKNKKLKYFKIFIINYFYKKFKVFKYNKILVINSNEILIDKKKLKKKIIYKYTKFPGSFKGFRFLDFYKNKFKELIKNYVIKSFKNKKIKKILKNNIKFIKNYNNKVFKNKIINLF